MTSLTPWGLALLFLTVGSAWAQAAPSSDPLARLRSIPPVQAEVAFAYTTRPDPAGLVGHNRPTWLQVGLQRGALEPLTLAALRGDLKTAEAVWPALKTAFAHQQADGSFEMAPQVDGVVQSARDQPTSVSFFVGELCPALRAVQGGPLAATFGQRAEALRPKLRATLGFLTRPDTLEILRSSDSPATNRLAQDAKALLLCGQLEGDEAALGAGQAFLEQVLARQTSEGVFPEHRGGDSGYQAVSLLKLEEVQLWRPDPRIEAALERGWAWELARIDAQGRVDVRGNTRTGLGQERYFGQPKGINTVELLRALALRATRVGTPEAARVRDAVYSTLPVKRVK